LDIGYMGDASCSTHAAFIALQPRASNYYLVLHCQILSLRE